MPAFPDPALLWITVRSLIDFVYGALTLYGALFQNASTTHQICNSVSVLTHRPTGPQPPPGNAVRLSTRQVWAVPISLAATTGVAVAFLSSGYLDVSVHPVPSTGPMCSDQSDTP